MSFLIFAAWRPNDPALDNSRWMAVETSRAGGLREDAFIMNGRATRGNLETALSAHEHHGLALFAHGAAANSITGSDGKPALDPENVGAVSGMWIHAVACQSDGLGVAAVEAGASRFVGYPFPLTVEWSIKDLPQEVAAAFGDVVTAVTLRLAAGEESEVALRRAVSDAIDHLHEIAAQTASLGLLWSAEQLNRFVLRSGFVRPAGKG